MLRSTSSLLALTVLCVACSSGSSGGAPTASAAPALPPVPAPDGLALECVLPAPDATWQKLRSQIGGAAAFLPTTAGGLVAVTLHFPLAVSEALDGRVPAVCAGTVTPEGAAHIVLGVHLRWPDRLLDGLTKGTDARFNTQADPATHIDVLSPRDPKDATYATGVLGNYLLIAAREGDLTALGPYVARSMPERAREFPTAGVRIAGVAEAPPLDLIARVPKSGFGGPVASLAKPVLRGLEQRASSFLPPELSFLSNRMTGSEAALPMLSDVEGAEMRVTIGDSATHIEATAPLRAGTPGEASARAIAAGSAAPLLAFPKDTLAGFFMRRAPSLPNANGAAAPAPSTAASIAKALGVNDTKDEGKIDQIASAFDAARGDWTAAGFAFDGTGPSAYIRAAVKDPAALDSALKDFLALADGASPKDPVRGQKLRVTTGKTVLENIPGDVYRVRLARSTEAAKKGAEPPAAKTETPAAVDLLFRRTDDVFVAATGYASRDALRAVLAAPTGESLAKVPDLSKSVDALGEGVALAAFFDPARIDASRAGRPGSASPTPVLIGLGRTLDGAATLFLKVDAPNTAIASLARWAAQ